MVCKPSLSLLALPCLSFLFTGLYLVSYKFIFCARRFSTLDVSHGSQATKGKEIQEEAESHRIRITLSSTNVASVEKGLI
jgi:hypothetical protein